MKAPNKISAVETETEIKWFFGDASSSWEPVEYIRKDALLEWAKNYKKLGVSDDFAYAMETLIKHLNSM